jgi:hypothetical protein
VPTRFSKVSITTGVDPRLAHAPPQKFGVKSELLPAAV